MLLPRAFLDAISLCCCRASSTLWKRNPEGIGFYMGRERGRIRMRHLTGKLWRLPVLWLPLLARPARAPRNIPAICTAAPVAWTPGGIARPDGAGGGNEALEGIPPRARRSARWRNFWQTKSAAAVSSLSQMCRKILGSAVTRQTRVSRSTLTS